MAIEPLAEQVLASERCPLCAGRIAASDIGGNFAVVQCSSCEWFVRAKLPTLRKTIIYLDTSTLSHMAKAAARGEQSRWLDLAGALKRAVNANVITCPTSPVIDDEAQLSAAVSRSVRELSRSLGDVRLRHSATVQECQLIRAFRRFLRKEGPMTEYAPPFTDISDDDPNEWLPVVQFSSLIHKTPPELIQSREGKIALAGRVTEIFARYAAEGLSFEEVRQREAAGVGSAVRRAGPLWPYLTMAREVAPTEEAAWSAVEVFLASPYTALIPSADITSRLYAVVATACGSRKNPRTPRSSDAHDIEQIASYLPYVDVVVADRFFAQVANERHVGLSVYRGRIQPLGENHIPNFIEWIESLVSGASHVAFGNCLYEEIERHGSFRRFTDRLGWTEPEPDTEA
jgi:hypothetical protein